MKPQLIVQTIVRSSQDFIFTNSSIELMILKFFPLRIVEASNWSRGY